MTIGVGVPAAQVADLREHPLSGQVPAMRAAEWAAFLADVARRGILEPLRLAPDGSTVLDGRHRLRAARELGLDQVPAMPALCEPGDEAVYMLRAALHRRHLSDDQRAMVGARLAGALGAARRRLQLAAAERSRWARPLAPTGTAPVPDGEPPGLPTRTVAARSLGVSERRLRMAHTLAQEAPDLATRVEAGRLPLLVAHTEATRRAARAELTQGPSPVLPAGSDVWVGEAAELAQRLPAGSVDLILTDPPWGGAFAGCWADLGHLAARVLRPGGFALVYVGHLHLPAVMAALSDGGLAYWWTVSIQLHGPKPAIRARRVRTGWRPVLVYVQPPAPDEPPWFSDWLASDPAPAKALHHWQQGLGPARQLVRRFAPAGGLVLDPFAGAGTFSAAAVLEGRQALGFEHDPGHAEVARHHLARVIRTGAMADAG
ncbi:MAG: DNA methyltransferase [Candidatus Dormibacteria bacterium]